MNFRSETEIDHFLSSFESGTLPRYCWTHAAHVAMCTARLWKKEPDDVIPHIRQGIKRYNASQGAPESAYHETLTVFWVNTIRRHMHAAEPPTRLDAVMGAVKTLGRDSGLPRKHYSFDVFQSEEARVKWIPPDR
jgi:hypothetical protein